MRDPLYISTFVVFLILMSACEHQSQMPTRDENISSELEAHLRFLASDEMAGRKPGSTEIKLAARYIAEQFRAFGLKPMSENDNFLQKVPIDEYENGPSQLLECNNVVGFVEGKDPALRDEFIVLVAHYDHLGILRDLEQSNGDSIYNGARDNGMGVVALLLSAKRFGNNPPARSAIFLATTGEEAGMQGSRYFVNQPPLSLKSIVLALNGDGGGYNDISKVRIGGKDRINLGADFWHQVEEAQISCVPYPKELEYLIEKGDYISFSQVGIPVLTISPGFDKIDMNILKYIHKPADEANDCFDYSYLLKYASTFELIARKCANLDNAPKWLPQYQ